MYLGIFHRRFGQQLGLHVLATVATLLLGGVGCQLLLRGVGGLMVEYAINQFLGVEVCGATDAHLLGNVDKIYLRL